VQLALADHCLTPPALAKRWRCKPARVIALIRRGALNAFNLGLASRPRYRITPESVKAFEQRRADRPEPATRRGRSRDDSNIVRFF
jgi:hypothetical protein